MKLDEWLDTFCPKAAKKDWSYEEVLKYKIPRRVPINRVWTVIQGERHRWIIPGRHIVNAEAYLVSELPWTDESLDVKFV